MFQITDPYFVNNFFFFFNNLKNVCHMYIWWFFVGPLLTYVILEIFENHIKVQIFRNLQSVIDLPYKDIFNWKNEYQNTLLHVLFCLYLFFICTVKIKNLYLYKISIIIYTVLVILILISIFIISSLELIHVQKLNWNTMPSHVAWMYHFLISSFSLCGQLGSALLIIYHFLNLFSEIFFLFSLKTILGRFWLIKWGMTSVHTIYGSILMIIMFILMILLIFLFFHLFKWVKEIYNLNGIRPFVSFFELFFYFFNTFLFILFLFILLLITISLFMLHYGPF